MCVLYDSAYPVSAREISMHIFQKGADAIRWIDIRHHFKSEIPLGISGNVTLSGFFQVFEIGLHRETGAAVFVEAWKRLLTFKPLARLAGSSSVRHAGLHHPVCCADNLTDVIDTVSLQKYRRIIRSRRHTDTIMKSHANDSVISCTWQGVNPLIVFVGKSPQTLKLRNTHE